VVDSIDARKTSPEEASLANVEDAGNPQATAAREGDHRLSTERKQTFGIGLLKGMAVTIKHLFKRNTVIQYPDEVQDLSPRTRGVIALKEENCTVCMLCARECPDWCIYIDSHKETLPPKRAGGRQRKRNVLDRFAIDYALCMYCGICVEVCPYDALFWSREFEYSEFDVRELTHEKERLSDWMATVLPPPPLEQGAMLPGQPDTAVAAGGAGPGSAQRPSPPTGETAAAERPEQAERPPAAAATAAPTPEAATQSQLQAGETQPAAQSASPGAPTEERAPEGATASAEVSAAAADSADGPAGGPVRDLSDAPTRSASTTSDVRTSDKSAGAEAGPSDAAAAATPNVTVPIEEPRPVALERTEDPQAVYDEVLQEQLDKGSSPQVAEARAKVARVKAERGIRRAPTPVETDKRVPSAPTKGQPTEPEPSGAPEAEAPQPDPGPVAPTEDER